MVQSTYFSVEFDELWKFLQKFTIWTGLVRTQKPRLWHIFAYFVWIITTPLAFIQAFWSLYHDPQMIIKLYVAVNIVSAGTVVFASAEFVRNEEYFFTFLEWCKSCHSLKIQGMEIFIQERVCETFRVVMKIAKFFAISMPIDLFAITIFPMVPKFLFESNNWRTPTYQSLPLLPSVDLKSYLINSILDFVGLIHISINVGVVYTFYFMAIRYIECQYTIMIEMLRLLSGMGDDRIRRKWFLILYELHLDTME